MRLFTAIDVPLEVRERLKETVDGLKPSATLRWSKAENFHITTKFLGEVSEDRLHAVMRALAGLHTGTAIPIAMRGIGWFPNPRAPRILYAGVLAPEWLAQLHIRTDEALTSLGVPKEFRRFRPHLTLARTEGKCDLAQLRREILALSEIHFGNFVAETFYLFSSQTQAGGSVYTKLAEFPV